MREVKRKDEKMKWPLISNGSSQFSTNQRKKSPSQAEGESMSYRTTGASEPQASPRQRPQPRGILFVLAIGLSIKSTFESKSCEFDDFNHVSNVLKDQFKSELDYDFDRDVSSHTTDTIDTIGVTHTPSFDFIQTGVGLVEFNTLECKIIKICGELTTIATIITNENQNKMKHEHESNEPLANTAQLKYSGQQVIDPNNRIDQTGIELRKFDNVGCIFNGKVDEIGLQYDASSDMLIFILIFIFTFWIVLW